MAERLYSTRELARLLGVTPEAVTGWIRHGWLAAEELPGTETRVSEVALVRFLKDRGIDLKGIMARLAGRQAADTPPADAGPPAARPHDSGLSATAPQEHEGVRSLNGQGLLTPVSPPQAQSFPAQAGPPAPPGADAIAEIIETIISDAARRGATAVHLESEADGLALRLRIAGRLLEKPHFKERLPDALRPQLVARLKEMAGIGGGGRSMQGAIALQVDGRDLRLLVVATSTERGEGIVLHGCDMAALTPKSHI